MGKQSDLVHIDPTKIKLNDDKIESSIFRNVRSTLKPEEMLTNRESIRKIGLLKPLMVRPLVKDPEGYLYQLVCGSRRLRNILKLRQIATGIFKEKRPFTKEELCFKPETAEWLPATDVYSTVKCFIRECNDEEAIIINIAENLEHAKVPDLDFMGFCQELTDLKNPDGTPRYTRREIAAMCNRHESWVSLTLELNDLPQRAKELLMVDRITRTGALSFLQTERDRIDEVIEVSENIIRQQKLAEADAADKELRLAQIDLSDAETDILIHEMAQNHNLRELAQKNANTNRKRVNAASEKKDKALKEAEAPHLTAEVINKANLITGAKKKGTRPKVIATSDLKKIYADFLAYQGEHAENKEVALVNRVLEVVLGQKAYFGIDTLLEPPNPESVSVSLDTESPHDITPTEEKP